MELFHENGHLTDEALSALKCGRALSDLSRLEIAEHLTYCDVCLMRYTDLLAETELEMPMRSCHGGLWHRIRLRSIRILTSRYATAAAALIIVFSLWGFGIFGGIVERSSQLSQSDTTFTQNLGSWPQQWNDSLNSIFDKLDGAFSAFSGNSNHNWRETNHES